MQTTGINPSPYSFYPSSSPSMPYGQVQNPYIPTPSYQPPTVPNPSQNSQMNQIRPQGILGRMIANPNEITPQEIPMDGSISMFPMQDGSAVYGKFWDSNGQIKTIRFVPENVDQTQIQEDPFAAINTRLDSIESLLKQRKKPYNKPYRKNYQNGSQESVKEPNHDES